ncbi:MAG: hypothetical protein H8E44_09990, partial [Planctomycetes bacterium]|nr:hypothetical protein [Planctomycetota bacterium]
MYVPLIHTSVVLFCISVAMGVSAGEPTSDKAEEALDYSISVFGPTHVFQGYGMRVGATVKKKSERGEIIALSVDGLPAGAECTFDFWSENRLYHQGTGVIHIVTSQDTLTGDYILSIKAASEKTKVERVATYSIKVDPVPEPLPTVAVKSNPPIPLLDRWEKQMVT